MLRTKAQVVLQYQQTLSHISEMHLLAAQIERLANSYRRETRKPFSMVREKENLYVAGEEDPAQILRLQAEELQTLATEWYTQAKQEYEKQMRELRHHA